MKENKEKPRNYKQVELKVWKCIEEESLLYGKNAWKQLEVNL